MTASRSRRRAAQAMLVVAVAVTAAPLIWMLGTSVKPPQAVFTDPLLPFPARPTWQNYGDVLRRTDVIRQFGNSLLFAGGVTVGQIAIAVPAAYAFARLPFRGSAGLFAAFLLTLPVPFVVFYVPNYLLLSRLGWLNTFPGLILPQIASAYGIFLLRQHFRAFPPAVIEAARVEGAGEWRIMWEIVLPASRGAIAALAVFVFVGTWNEYVWPLLVARDERLHILTVGVAQFASSEGGAQWGAIMAAATIATLPTVGAYLLVRRQLLAVLLEGAVKG